MRLVLEALQPVESMIVNSAADTKRMIEAVDHPALKACLDMGAMAVAGDTIDDYFDLLGDDVAHVHFVDVAADDTTHLAWGDGNRDMRADLDSSWRVATRAWCLPRPMTGAISPTPRLPMRR